MAYCTLANVKLDLARSDAADDTMLNQYITEIGDYISGVIGYTLDADATTQYIFDGYDAIQGYRRLLIPGGVRTISLLEVAVYTGASFTTVSSSDYLLRPLVQDRAPGWPATEVQLSEVSASYFPPGYSNVRVTGTFGFAAVPARVEGVARRTVVRAYAARQAGGNDLLATGGDSGAPLVSQFLSRRDREVLMSFKTPNVR